MYFMVPNGYVLAGIGEDWVCMTHPHVLRCSEGACAKGQLGVQRLVDCDCSMTDTFWNY